MRVTVGTLVGLTATGKAIDKVLAAYAYIEREDVLQALTNAALAIVVEMLGYQTPILSRLVGLNGVVQPSTQFG
jgi:hypothetical protein